MACSSVEPARAPAPTPTAAGAMRVQVAGHRGAKGIAPENTLAGFQLALDLNVDMIELDVHLTKDNELVVMHDPHVDRTTDGSGHINDLTLAEVREFNAAAKFAGEKSYPPQKVPTLQEVYDLVAGRCPINVEIKTPGERGRPARYPGIEQKVLDLVRRNDALSYTVISSFDFATLEEVRRLEPAARTYAIISTAYFKEMGLQGKGPEDVAADMADREFRWVAVDKLFMTPEIAAAFQSRGITAHAWVINTVEDLERFRALGVQYVTSDRPDLLLGSGQ